MSDKSTPKQTLQDEINNAVSNALKDTDFINETITAKVKSTVASVIEDMFTWGAVKDAIKAKLTAVMVPAIEAYDFSKYTQRLDVVLTELVHSPDLVCNNKLLNNFRTIVTPPDVKSITLKQLFAEYCNFVSKNVDTDDREVIVDGDEVYYEPVSCDMTSENIRSSRIDGHNERYRLDFHAEDAKSEYNEDLNAEVEVYRWHWMPANEYHLSIHIDPRSIKYISDFEAYIYSLSLANILVDITPEDNIESGIYMDDMVIPDKEPEPTYQ